LRIGRLLPALLVALATRAGVRAVARLFIAGEDAADAQATLLALHARGRDATLDQLGELVVSEAEADGYADAVLALVRGVPLLPAEERRNRAGIRRAHVSIKLSALCAHFDPADPTGTTAAVLPRLRAILRAAHERGVFINIDAEHVQVRDLSVEVLDRTLQADPELDAHAEVGVVLQAYLRDAAAHLDRLLGLARRRGVRLPIRLVKGAYWDQETAEATAHDVPATQWLNKVETDVHFQQLARRMLAHGELVQLCVGSHNLRDHAFARAVRALRHPDAPEVEHQVLHMTYEPLAEAMSAAGWCVRAYVPVGSLLVGMAYLVRRIMENSSQVGVLTQARRGPPGMTSLQPPARALREAARRGQLRRDPQLDDDAPAFVNVAPIELYRPTHRAAFERAIRAARLVPAAEAHAPASEALADRDAVEAAVRRAARHAPDFAATDARARAAVLARAAERMRVLRLDLAVLIATEAGKSRPEALADVDEAIDFLRFYGQQGVRLATEGRLARGVIAVIAPWNFPLAIPTGMVAGALAAGNTVVLKSAEQTPMIARELVRILHGAGLPRDALHHLVGDGPTTGAALAEHPDLAGLVFTGSQSVGTWLYDNLAPTIAPAPPLAPDAAPLTRAVITEMGGKNAVIVTATAELDEAVSGVLYAAFAHAGQKCSAASRVLVHEDIAARFVARFERALGDLRVGDPLQPGVDVNPVISDADAERLEQAWQRMRDEALDCGGRALGERSDGSDDHASHDGHNAPSAPPPRTTAHRQVVPRAVLMPLAEGLRPGSSAQRELFGPLVHVMTWRTLDEVIDAFHATPYALTGGVYSQSQDEIATLSARLQCGNLYVNRPNTAARVSIEPFGGFRMSGTGPKAGSETYLRAFTTPNVEVPRTRPDTGVFEEPLIAAPTPDAPVPRRASGPRRAVDDRAAWDPTWLADLARQRGDAASGAAARSAAVARLLGEPGAPHPLSGTPGAEVARALHRALAPQLAAVLQRAEPTRAIPGQRNADRVDVPRGPVVILGQRHDAPAHAWRHLVAALLADNRVEVLACNEPAWRAWQPLLAAVDAAAFDRDRLVVRAVHVEALREALGGPDIATVVLDDTPDAWLDILPDALRTRDGQAHLRKLYSASDDPTATDDPVRWLRAHLLRRTIAEHTMRHGAPLELDLPTNAS
jgi:RHH-type proline utilization regulon transcriptional repressor/proline dehydrogenase/delta 1-pyrroline-5-carboxylate dehydrogenase